MRLFKLSYLPFGLLCSGLAFGQTTPTPTTPDLVPSLPAESVQLPPKPVVKSKPTTSPQAAIAKTVSKNVTATTKPPASIVAAPVMIVAEFTNEQKLLIENAQKLDALNKELLTRNQQLQVTNEKLSLQVEILKHDRYSEGTRDTLISIIVGVLLGWLLFRTKKRPRYRDF
jgi:hypothetical protein